MSATRPSSSVEVKSAAAGALPEQVFDVLAARLAERRESVATFAETGVSFQPWVIWEGLEACRAAGWTVTPRPAYADVGVTGSRETADLAVFHPASGARLLLEVALVHDWSTNRWIDDLNAGTARLRRPRVAGTHGLRVIVAVSLASPIEVNPTWRGWLGMTNIWSEASPLRRAERLGPVGEMLCRGWIVG